VRGGSITGVGVMEFAKHPTFARYVGEWQEGAFEGRGQLFLKNEEQYSGQWARGARSGLGQYLYAKAAAQAVYRGCWAADLYEGDGVLTFNNGQTLTAQFKQGLAEGLGVTLDKKGKVLNKGLFSAGNFVSEAKAEEPKIKALQARCAKDFGPERFPDYPVPAPQESDFSRPTDAAGPKKEAARDRSQGKAGPQQLDKPADEDPMQKVSIKTRADERAKSKDPSKAKEEPEPKASKSKESKSKEKKIKKVSIEGNEQ
jgi:hypothetical protein